MEHHETLSDAKKRLNPTPAERVQFLVGVLDKLKIELTKFLISPEQEPFLDESFKKVMNFYKEQYSNTNR